MRYFDTGTKRFVELSDSDFKAKGGEGSVYISNGRVYKICEPGFMIPEAKFKELSVLTHPRIIRPETILLDSGKKHAVGYTMKLVPKNPISLAEMLSKAYQEREGVTAKTKADLVMQIREGVQFTHDKGREKFSTPILIVDENENNFMVTDDYSEVYFIDVGAWQTPHFPCPVLNPSVWDFHCNNHWTELSDWYSFGIIAWWLFIGNHPFKIFHPILKTLKDAMINCMKANKSMLDPQADYPQAAVYYPFENHIPGGNDGAFMQWFRAMWIDGKRLPPPTDYQAALVAIITKVKEIVGSNNFNMNLLFDFGKNGSADITAYYQNLGKEVVVTKSNIVVDRQFYPRINQRFRIGFTPTNKAVAVYIDDDRLKIMGVENQLPINIDAAATAIMAYDGRVYVQSGTAICELTFIEMGQSVLTALQPVANIIEHATQLFQGVAFQQMFGAYMVSVFPKQNQHQQFKIVELEGYRITDAKFDSGVLMVVGTKGRSGQYDRFVIRFHPDWSKYECKIIEDISPIGLNFTVIRGVCVCITEEQKVEVFAADPRSTQQPKTITDPAIQNDMHLCHGQHGVQFARGSKLFSFAMR